MLTQTGGYGGVPRTYWNKAGRACSACVHAGTVSVLVRITQALPVSRGLSARTNQDETQKEAVFFSSSQVGRGWARE